MGWETGDDAGKLGWETGIAEVGRERATKEGNDPRPDGRDERRVEGNDWAMAAKPEGRPEPEGRPRAEGRPGMRLDSWDGRPGMRLDSWDGSVLTKEGNDPRPDGRDERRVEGNDWAMAAKPEGRPEPEGRPRAEGKTGDEAGKLGWECAYQGR